MALQAECRSTRTDNLERALLRAESAKGRVLSWLSTRDPAAAAKVLDPGRQVAALERARAWLAAGPGRRAVSLFAASHGVAVLSMRPDATLEGAWLDDVDYDSLREGVFLPFERAVDEALRNGDTALARVSSALLDHLLAIVGTWLWRAAPTIADGGTELLLLPHGLLRALPVAHALLPTGRRLSEIFESVSTAPSLDMAFVTGTGVARPDVVNFTAVVDAQGDLPFAACEALGNCDPANLRRGSEATAGELMEALGADRVALVSMHGEFVGDDPFAHRIFAADRRVELRELLLKDTPVRAPAVILGVCEAGLQRQSVSDEPIGFPALLLLAGAGAVLAPLWKVDDFASLHFMTQLTAHLKRNVPVPRAALAAAQWLRGATAPRVIAATDAIIEAATARLPADDPLLTRIRDRAAAQRRWLDTLARDARPFAQTIDWGAFQVTVRIPSTTSTEA
jgi:hypothetical protein